MGLLERLELQRELEAFFQVKRVAYLESHGQLGKPALILQCMPAETVVIDLATAKLAEALAAGGGPTAKEGWWDQFKARNRPNLTFDGVTSARKQSPDEWATEVHVDGHVAAGVWRFPSDNSNPSAQAVGVADFYSQVFDDFAYLTRSIFESAGYSGMVHMTCTLLRADLLPLVNEYGNVVVPASKRETLRWPNLAVASGAFAEAGKQMADQFLRIYGRAARRG